MNGKRRIVHGLYAKRRRHTYDGVSAVPYVCVGCTMCPKRASEGDQTGRDAVARTSPIGVKQQPPRSGRVREWTVQGMCLQWTAVRAGPHVPTTSPTHSKCHTVHNADRYFIRFIYRQNEVWPITKTY